MRKIKGNEDDNVITRWFTVNHYCDNEPPAEFSAVEKSYRKRLKNYQKYGMNKPTKWYGDVDGDLGKAAIAYDDYIKHEESRKKKIRNTRFINPISNDTSAAEWDLGVDLQDKDVYAYNRERRQMELNEEYDIANEIINIKKYIIKLKKLLNKMQSERPRTREELDDFGFDIYEINILSISFEIQKWEKQLQYYMDPLCGYNISTADVIVTEEECIQDIEKREQAEEEEKKVNIVEIAVKGFQELSKKYIDPVLKGIKQFIKRNEKSISYLLNFAACAAVIVFKAFGI